MKTSIEFNYSNYLGFKLDVDINMFIDHFELTKEMIPDEILIKKRKNKGFECKDSNKKRKVNTVATCCNNNTKIEVIDKIKIRVFNNDECKIFYKRTYINNLDSKSKTFFSQCDIEKDRNFMIFVQRKNIVCPCVSNLKKQLKEKKIGHNFGTSVYISETLIKEKFPVLFDKL